MKRLWLLLIFTSSLSATEHSPWFPPLWEFQGQLSYAYERVETVQSLKGNFNAPSNNHTVSGSLGVTPWPYWNVEVELLLTHTSNLPFSYEAIGGTVRYQWLDDIRGGPIAFATGITLSFPGKRYLHDFSFAYHGEINGELHATIGKEWTHGNEWWMRGWALGGWGIANRGNGWLHGIVLWEFKPKCFEWGIFTEALYGLGSNDIILSEPFPGYASISHRTIDIGSYLNFDLDHVGILTLRGWYNVYAHNFILHNWGLIANFLVPFSL